MKNDFDMWNIPKVPSDSQLREQAIKNIEIENFNKLLESEKHALIKEKKRLGQQLEPHEENFYQEALAEERKDSNSTSSGGRRNYN